MIKMKLINNMLMSMIYILFLMMKLIKLSFYTVPQVDVFATDSEGGLIGTVGSFTDLQSDLPICYINKNKECFLVANKWERVFRNN